MNSDAKLMRAVGAELVRLIAPELRSDGARERVAFMQLVLDDLAAGLDIVPGVAREHAPRLHRILEDVLASLPARFPGADYTESLANILPRRDEELAFEIADLRILSANLARALSDFRPSPVDEEKVRSAVAILGSADRAWLRALEAARHTSSFTPEAAAGGTVSGELITTHSLTDYLQRTIPNAPAVEARSVNLVPGGRSKRTLFVEVANSGGVLPDQIVIRQDMYAEKRGTTVRDEYKPLMLLSGMGLPVPKPLHFESNSTDLGPPFMLVERLEGQVPGNYFGMEFSCPHAFRDLARLLAKLHSLGPAEAGVPAKPASAFGRLGAQVEEFWTLWRTNSLRASPVIESAYAWARQQCAAFEGDETLVHGDCGPHNLLVQDGRLAGLLDWEFLHVGDPAEDLGIARVYAETMMPWDEFMAEYRAAGGGDVSEARVNVGVLNHYLKGTTLVAASGRNFAEGHTNDFIKGANAYTGLRKIEMKIAEFMQRVP